MRKTSLLALFLAILMITAVPSLIAEPAPRNIPGITAKDAFPTACVGCHNGQASGAPKFSTLLKQWEKVDPAKLAKTQAIAPKGVTLKGKHPPAATSLKNVPAGCIKCHGATSKIAPPMNRLVHLIHFSGGKDNRFLTAFQGECTHCHKFDPKTGNWSIPNAAEK